MPSFPPVCTYKFLIVFPMDTCRIRGGVGMRGVQERETGSKPGERLSNARRQVAKRTKEKGEKQGRMYVAGRGCLWLGVARTTRLSALLALLWIACVFKSCSNSSVRWITKAGPLRAASVFPRLPKNGSLGPQHHLRAGAVWGRDSISFIVTSFWYALPPFPRPPNCACFSLCIWGSQRANGPIAQPGSHLWIEPEASALHLRGAPMSDPSLGFNTHTHPLRAGGEEGVGPASNHHPRPAPPHTDAARAAPPWGPISTSNRPPAPAAASHFSWKIGI